MAIYPSSMGDYYPKTWHLNEYKSQLQLILNTPNDDYLAISDYQFEKVGMVRRIYEFAKSFFGFSDRANPYAVNSALLKFFYYGLAHNFLDDRTINNIRERIHNSSHLNHPSIVQLFYNHAFDTRSADSSRDRLTSMRVILIQYHQENAAKLQPSFWSRLFLKQIAANRLTQFGDTALELAQQALTGREVNPAQALQHFFEAQNLINASPEFQRKLGDQFISFLEAYRTHPSLADKLHTIQEMIGYLAFNAFILYLDEAGKEYLTKLEACYPQEERVKKYNGEFYLKHRKYQDALPYLPRLEHHYAHNAGMLLTIAKAYEQLGDEEKKIGLYHKVMRLYSSQKTRISEASLTALLEPISLEEAQLNQVSFDLFKYDQKSFERQYGGVYIQFLRIATSALMGSHSNRIQEVLMGCLSLSLKAHQGMQTNNYLDIALQLYSENQEMLEKMVEECITYKALDSLAHIQHTYASHAYLQFLLARAYEKLGQVDKAVHTYKECINLFKSQSRPFLFQRQIALAQTQLGKIYLNQHHSSSQAIDYFIDAINNDSTVKEARENLYMAYIHIWQHTPQEFEKTYIDQWMHFLQYLIEDQTRQLYQNQIKDVLLSCAESAFQRQSRERVRQYLNIGFTQFKGDTTFICKAADLHLKYQAWAELLNLFETLKWNKNHASDPLIQARFSETLWEIKDKQASRVCENTIQLFAPLANSMTEEKKKPLASLHVRMARYLSEKGSLFTSPPYDKILDHLEKAFTNNPTSETKEWLVRLYLDLGKEEDKKFFNKNELKVIDYYSKAFETKLNLENSDLLIRLIELYFKHNQAGKAQALYNDIKRIEGFSTFELPKNLLKEIKKCPPEV